MQLRDYQKDIVKRGIDIIADHQLLYLQMEVRTGKTLTALAICEELGAASVLFITKKKAISSIINDYENYGFDFYINVINNESLHKVEGEYDIVVSDEHHRNASFPKPNKSAKIIKQRWANLPMIFLSGTPNAESYSQVYHQYWLSNNSPFKQWPNFYKWAQQLCEHNHT